MSFFFLKNHKCKYIIGYSPGLESDCHRIIQDANLKFYWKLQKTFVSPQLVHLNESLQQMYSIIDDDCIGRILRSTYPLKFLS